MDLSLIAGNSLATKFLFYTAILFVIGDLVVTLFTIMYQKFLYDKLLRPRYTASYAPRCAIIVPCKGVPKELGNNLRAFLNLEYPSFSVVYSVESDQDSAVPVIKKIMAEDPRAHMTVAGLATKCAQKNYNLLAALKEASDAEVYVFADADIKPEPSWLRELILPLSNDKVTVTSGFRWLLAKQGTIGELAHFYVNAIIYVLFSTACFFGGVGLWGGSMAIRRKDFEALHVAEKWSRASVDDISLSYLVLKARKKAVVVPQCVIHTDDLIQTMKGTISWFERQIMYLKAYQKAIWFFVGMPMLVFGILLIMVLPAALLLSLSPEKTFFAAGGGAGLIFYAGELLTVTLYRFLGPVHARWKFCVIWPFLRFTHGISLFLTIITNTITWAGIKYKIGFNGDVASVKRP